MPPLVGQKVIRLVDCELQALQEGSQFSPEPESSHGTQRTPYIGDCMIKDVVVGRNKTVERHKIL